MLVVSMCSTMICSFLTRSLTVRYFSSMCFEPFELLLFFEKNITKLLSQKIFIGQDMESTSSNPEMKFFNQNA